MKEVTIDGVTFLVNYKVDECHGDWNNAPERHVEIFDISHEGDPVMDFLNELTIDKIYEQI